MDKIKVLLSAKDVPKQWYNVKADLPFSVPASIDPVTKEPVRIDKDKSVFCGSLVEQEESLQRWIAIPEPVRNALSIWRPTPLRRAINLEKVIKTKCRIYYKDESVASAGSFKQNTAVAQAYYNKTEGVSCLTTETGAGQWGSALSFACNLFGLKCRVYMVRLSYELKPFRRSLMRLWGAEVIRSPSKRTVCGRKILKKTPKTTGSLGISASEAVEGALVNKNTKYAAASLFDYVSLHQTVIGLETKEQLKLIDEKPDYLIGCVGGGSNFAGLVFPFLRDKLKGSDMRMIAIEPASCPSLTKGAYIYDYADTGKFSSLQKMYTLGHSFVPPPVHTTGLRYHGCSPIISLLYNKKILEARAYHQIEVLKAGVLFAKTEGILPAPETTHAIKAAIDIAKSVKKSKCIVINFSGHGFFDLAAYEKFLDKKLKNYAYPTAEVKRAIKQLLPLQP